MLGKVEQRSEEEGELVEDGWKSKNDAEEEKPSKDEEEQYREEEAEQHREEEEYREEQKKENMTKRNPNINSAM